MLSENLQQHRGRLNFSLFLCFNHIHLLLHPSLTVSIDLISSSCLLPNVSRTPSLDGSPGGRSVARRRCDSKFFRFYRLRCPSGCPRKSDPTTSQEPVRHPEYKCSRLGQVPYLRVFPIRSTRVSSSTTTPTSVVSFVPDSDPVPHLSRLPT